MNASHSRHLEAEWAIGFVRRMLLNSASVRMYSAAPYLAELYRPDLSERIRHPADVGDRSCAPPLALLLGGKTYFMPGSAEDLILYVSSVVACAAAIARSLPADAEEDHGPPARESLRRGEGGSQAELRAAWKKLNTETHRRLVRDRLWVVCSDIHDCIGTVNPDRLHGLLEEAGAEAAALAHLARMQGVWQQAGCRGLPLTGGFLLLIKLYLAEVDARLRREGIAFIRLQDDFRLFCRSRDEALCATEVLTQALAACGMRINEGKQRLLAPGPRAAGLLRGQTLNRLFQHGVGQPLLCEMLQTPLLRPVGLGLLRRLYGHHCWEMPIAKDLPGIP